MQSVELGMSHAWDRVTVSLTERYRTFDFDTPAFLPGASEGSDPEAPTRLDPANPGEVAEPRDAARLGLGRERPDRVLLVAADLSLNL